MFKHLGKNEFRLVEADLDAFVKLLKTGEADRKKQALEQAYRFPFYFFKLYLKNNNRDADLKRVNNWGEEMRFYQRKRRQDSIELKREEWFDIAFPEWRNWAKLEAEKHVDTLDLSDAYLDKNYDNQNGMLKWSYGTIDGPHLYDPVWANFSFKQVLPENTWLIHFARKNNAMKIAKNGFDHLVTDPTKLSYTFYRAEEWIAGSKGFPRGKDGYGFAFTAENIKNLNKPGEGKQEYGQGWSNIDTMVMFQSKGVLAYHRIDKANEVIFSGSDAKNMVIINMGRDHDWYGVHVHEDRYDEFERWAEKNDPFRYRTKDYEYAFEAKTLKEVIEWVEKNFNTYKRFISKI